MAVDGYVDAATIANWFNTNLVGAPVAFSQVMFLACKQGVAPLVLPPELTDERPEPHRISSRKNWV